ncbi:MAG: hypothetical protein ABIR17_13045 [Pseudolysinimonas sp.]|uniref:hypothetical protein n=1 Tax=Pseudolysinimonas sp. TaxID=2680009 RepID=UPI0032672401
MTTTTLKRCALDRAGIPDLSDLESIDLDLEAIAGVSFHVAVDEADPQRPAYYPFAAVDLWHELVFIPLPRETDPAAAGDAITLLRAALPPGNAVIAGIARNDSNTGNTCNTVNAGNVGITRYAGITVI